MIDLKISNLSDAIESKMDRSKWKTYKFSDLVENIVEKVVPKNSGLQHYIGLEHLDSGSLKIKRFGETESLIGDKLKIYKGDLIFAKRNSYLKRVAIAGFDAVASAHSMVLRPKAKNIDPNFLPFFMMSEVFWKRAIEISVGSLSPTINWKSLAKQEFLLPPKAEQARLAELLWAMDEVIEKEKGVLERINIIKNVLSDNYFNPNKQEDKLVNLGMVSKLTAGGTPNTEKNEYWEGGNIPWLSSGEVHKKVIHHTDNFITELGLKNSSAKLMPSKTIFIALAGQGKTKGTVAISEIETCTNQSVASIVPNIEIIEPYYLYYNLDSRYLDFRHITGKENSRTGLNLKILNNFKIVVHDKIVREKIIDEFIVIDENINSIEDRINKSQYLQKSLINQIF